MGTKGDSQLGQQSGEGENVLLLTGLGLLSGKNALKLDGDDNCITS